MIFKNVIRDVCIVSQERVMSREATKWMLLQSIASLLTPSIRTKRICTNDGQNFPIWKKAFPPQNHSESNDEKRTIVGVVNGTNGIFAAT